MNVSEADESATDKLTALANLREQAAKGETMGVVSMYELAAWKVGATPLETEDAIKQGNEDFRSSVSKPHWVYGSGSYGCLYDNGPNLATTLEDAIDGVLFPFLDCDPCLTDEQESEARQALRSSYHYDMPRGLGADYCEVSECRCSDPSQHGEAD